MEPITFNARPSRKLAAILIRIPVLAIMLWAAFYFTWDALALLSSTDDQVETIAALRITMALVAIAAIPVSIVATVLAVRHAGPERNFLQITQAGLNYMRHGKARFWAWSELSDFNTISKYSRIEFALTGTGLNAAKRDPWIHEIRPDGPIAVIHDIYDTSLDDIVAALNAYREKAIGSGSKTMEP